MLQLAHLVHVELLTVVLDTQSLGLVEHLMRSVRIYGLDQRISLGGLQALLSESLKLQAQSELAVLVRLGRRFPAPDDLLLPLSLLFELSDSLFKLLGLGAGARLDLVDAAFDLLLLIL